MTTKVSSCNRNKTNDNENIYWFQILAVISVCLCSASVGLNLGWANPYVPELLSSKYNYTSDEVSYIAVLSPVGYVVGGPLNGYLANAMGRKFTLLSTAVWQIIAWVILGLSNSVVMFCIGRMMAGVAEITAYMLIPMYIGEIAHPKIRGRLTTFLSLSIGVGTISINVFGTYVNVSHGSFICLTLPVLFVLTFVWMPESPYYYLMKGKMEKARQSLQALRRREDVADELTQLNMDVKRQLSESGTLKDVFFIPSNLLAMVIVIAVRFFQHYSGISAFLHYGRKLFQDAGSCFPADTSSIIVSISTTVLLVVGTLMIDIVGRRRLFIISCVSTTIILACISAYYYLHQYHEVDVPCIPFINVIIYTVTFSLGLGVGPNVLAGEMISVSVKSKVLFIANIINGLTQMSSSKVFQVLSDAYGHYSPFILYTGCTLAGCVFAYFLIPETKGKTLEEIQTVMQEMSGKVCVCCLPNKTTESSANLRAADDCEVATVSVTC